MSDANDPGSETVELLVRNPSASFSKDLKLRVSSGASIQALKEKLTEEYDGHPLPANQKLIISGQIVKETQLLKDVLKHANLAEPQVVHLVIAGPKPDGPSSSTPLDRDGTQNAPAPPSFAAPAVPPPDRNQPSVASASRSTPPRRPPPPAPESGLGGASSSVGAPQSARSLSEQIGGSQRVQSMPSPLTAAPSTSASQQAGVRSSAPSNPPQQNPSLSGQQGAQQPTSGQGTASPNQDAPSQSEAGPSSAGQSSGTPAGPAAGLSQEALQQLYLQLLQSNPFLTPLACNLAALSMGLPPPQTSPGGPPPLAALFPGFNFAAAPQGGAQDQGAGDQHRGQGGQFMGLFQPPAGAGGQPVGAFGQNRAFAFPLGNQGAPLQGAQIHFVHPGALHPQGLPPDAAAQAGLRQRAGQNGAQAPPVAQFGGIPQGGQFGGIPQGQFGGIPQGQFGGVPQGVPVVVRVRRIQVDFMLVAKLAVIVFVLNQDGSFERLVLLTFLAALAYLYQTGVLAPYLRLATERLQRYARQQGYFRALVGGPNQGPPANGVNAPNPVGGGGLAGAVQRQRAGGGIIREIQLFVMGFITSLLPGFQAPEGLPEPGQEPPPPGPPPLGAQGGAGANDRPHHD